MVSILGDYNYTFPKPIPLKLKLKDMLEDNVDEKYFLSDAMINYVSSRMPAGDNKITTGISVGNRDSLTKAATLCTTGGTRATDNYIIENEDYDYSKEEGRIVQKHLRETLEQREEPIKDGSYIDTYNRKINKEKSGTITTGVSFRNNTFLAIKKDTENYIEWEEKGKIDMNCRAWKDKVGTLNTGGETKILIKNATKQGYLEATDGDGIDLAMPNSETRRGRVQKEAIQTLTTQNNLGVVSDLRIRKLTPRECGRLMNVKDEDIDKIKLSDSAMFHIFGDSICTNILMAIFGELLDIDWKTKLEEMLSGDTN